MLHRHHAGFVLARLLHGWTQSILALGAPEYLSARLSDWAKSLGSDDPVLDLGCGYASPLKEANIWAVGVDIDFQRLRNHATGLAVLADAASLPFRNGSFAAAFSFGLLHHLDEGSARRAIGEALRVVRAGGLIVLFDGIMPESWRKPVPKLIRALDGGNYMRDERALVALFDGLSGWSFERVTYAATGLEGVWCVYSVRQPEGLENADRGRCAPR